MAETDRPQHIVFLDRDTLPPETVLKDVSFPHILTVHGRTSLAEVAERITDADIVITNKVPVSAEAIRQAERLKFIAVAATGYDNVDLATCAERGITVSNIRNYAARTVPEHTFALILALRRSILPYHQSVARGDWQKSGQFCYFDYPVHGLAGSTLGIIGDGTLGRSVAKLGEAFGMRVLFSAHKGRTGMGSLYTPFKEVLQQSDVITLHCPLKPATRNMIAAPEFALMERRPVLINTSRGGLVDEIALCDALESGQISGAGFDVVTKEPIPQDHPFMRIMHRPDFILTPHVAWSSRNAIQTLADQLIENIELYHKGAPRNVVQKTA